MSGGPGDTPPPIPPSIPCDELEFETTLWSPQPAIVGILVVGEVLDVGIEEEAGIRRVAVRRGADLAGTIIGDRLASLIRCLQQGVVYGAEVRRVDGGQVVVRVRPQT